MILKYKFAASIFAAASLMLAVQASASPMLEVDNVNGGSRFGYAPTDEITVGYRFTANENISVYSLGIVNAFGDGLQIAHSVGLWSESGTLMSSVFFAPGSGTADAAFLYLNTPSAISLAAGQTYRIAATFGGNDASDKVLNLLIENFDSYLNINSAVSIEKGNAWHLDDLAENDLDFPDGFITFTSGNRPSFIVTSNFLFTAEQSNSVPEPDTLALLCLGLAGLGYQFRKKRSASKS